MQPGQVVGERYALQEVIGRGGRGEVWLAEDVLLPRRVALKRSRFAGGRMMAEARALARFSSGHVVTLHDVREIEGQTWLVMEYLPGGSLAGRPGMPADRIAVIGEQVATALAAMHAEGFVHCDVKPANILLTADGTAKLTDFDAAYRLPGAETRTANGEPAFTPGYAAPEVVMHAPCPASDVYSLGVTLRALASGRPARGSDLSDAPVPGSLRLLLDRMCREAARDRPTITEVRSRLLHLAGLRSGNGGSLVRPPRRRLGASRLSGVPAAPVWVAGLVVLAAVSVPGLLMAGRWPFLPDEDAPLVANEKTVDPCALADAGVLGRFGQATVDSDYGEFDRCDVLVYPDDDAMVDVEINLHSGPEPGLAAPVRTVDGVGIVEQPAESDACERYLLPRSAGEEPVGYMVRVTAKTYDDGRPPLCAMADAAAAQAAEVLGRGPLPDRSPSLPDESLVWEDACRLIDPGVLAATIPGVDVTDVDPGFGNFACEWHSTSEETDLSLRFDRHPPLDAEEGRPTRLAGRGAFVEPAAEGEGTCIVRVVHRAYVDAHGEPAVELLMLTATGAGTTDEMCRVATTLAESAVAGLESG